MSQRSALFFSIALTVVLIVGVIIGRDRLFATGQAEGNAAAVSTPTISTSTARTFQMDATTKVLDIVEPLPTSAVTSENAYDWNGDSSDSDDDHATDDHEDHHSDDHEDHDDD